ncbi:hypothetical protein CR513_33395, partial [Mucuna pruriens]
MRLMKRKAFDVDSHVTKPSNPTVLTTFLRDGGSCANVASEGLVKKLALPTIVHPRSYRLQWLSEKRKLLMDKQVEVIFTLEGYEDKVVCDVVPMEATHFLLGRP